MWPSHNSRRNDATKMGPEIDFSGPSHEHLTNMLPSFSRV
jgi:hypothetical protein